MASLDKDQEKADPKQQPSKSESSKASSTGDSGGGAHPPKDHPEFDPNAAPATGESELDRHERLALEALEKGRADAKAPRFNKDFFYGPRGTEYRDTRLDAQHGPDHAHFVTAEELAYDILGRAGVSASHPELVIPIANTLKKELKA